MTREQAIAIMRRDLRRRDIRASDKRILVLMIENFDTSFDEIARRLGMTMADMRAAMRRLAERPAYSQLLEINARGGRA